MITLFPSLAYKLSCFRGGNSPLLPPAEADPLANIIGQASPYGFHSYIPQTTHAKASKTKLGFNPKIGSFGYLRPCPINFSSAFRFHFLAELDHLRQFFYALNRSAFFTVRTALPFGTAALAIGHVRTI
jgi:hypothetical protein